MIYKIMIGKRYVYKNCEELKCDVKDVVYLKNEKGSEKWSAYDVPTGLLIVKAKTKKALIEKINELKEKIEYIRSRYIYKNLIKNKEEFEVNNTDEMKKEGLNT